MWVIVCLLLLFQPPSAAVAASPDHVSVGESVVYAITTTEATWVDVELPQEMTILNTTPDCIVQPTHHAYCILDTSTLTLTAQLDRPLCGPIGVDVVVADVTRIHFAGVTARADVCPIYFPMIFQ